MGNGFVGCCGRWRRHPSQFFPGQLGAIGAQSHGRSWGRYGAENCPNWLVLLDYGCFLHRISSKNENRENQQTTRSAIFPGGFAASGGPAPNILRRLRLSNWAITW